MNPQKIARVTGVLFLITIFASIPAQFIMYAPVLNTPGKLRLLMFIETRGKDGSWRKRMDLWNQSEASSKKERYEDLRNFRKAYMEVRELVLEPNYISAERNKLASRIARRRRIQNELTSRGPDIEPDIDFVR